MTRISRIHESPGAAGPLLDAVPEVADLFGMADPETGEMPDWRDFAECQYVDPDLFHVEKGESTRPAKQVCAMCPVAVECLEFALVTEQKFGVWGGFSEQERRLLRRARQREALQRAS